MRRYWDVRTVVEMSADPTAGAATVDVCISALAEIFRGDGEILAHPIGIIPTLAAQLAKSTFEPDLVLGCGEAVVGSRTPGTEHVVIESHLPMRRVFDMVWAGRRHVVMGASQIDAHGNQNIAAIGEDYARPRVQLLGYRGAPGNTICHTTSYWIPAQSPRVMVDEVDVVCGVGYRRAAALDPRSARRHELRRVVTDLATFDFETADRRMRVRSVHPGNTLGDVLDEMGFEPAIGEYPPPVTQIPTPRQIQIIEDLDPMGSRHREMVSHSARA